MGSLFSFVGLPDFGGCRWVVRVVQWWFKEKLAFPRAYHLNHMNHRDIYYRR